MRLSEADLVVNIHHCVLIIFSFNSIIIIESSIVSPVSQVINGIVTFFAMQTFLVLVPGRNDSHHNIKITICINNSIGRQFNFTPNFYIFNGSFPKSFSPFLNTFKKSFVRVGNYGLNIISSFWEGIDCARKTKPNLASIEVFFLFPRKFSSLYRIIIFQIKINIKLIEN